MERNLNKTGTDICVLKKLEFLKRPKQSFPIFSYPVILAFTFLLHILLAAMELLSMID